MLLLACLTGMRVSEIAKAAVQDLKHFQRDDTIGTAIQWHLRVVGKGNKFRRIPLPTVLIGALEEYLRKRGFSQSLASLVSMERRIPLIGHLPKKASLGALPEPHMHLQTASMGEAYKTVFERAARALAVHDEDAGKALAKASAHWLRHTHATHSIRLGTSVAMTKDNLGHASIDTTSIYTHTDLNERHEQMEAFAEKFAAG